MPDDSRSAGSRRPRRVKRLVVAEIIYLALALVATFTLDGLLRTALWLFFLWLAIKTLSAWRADGDDEDDAGG